MLLSNNNIIIFSHPRTGTKLLAKILEGFGYHNHGEWFSLLSARIEGDKAVRREQYIEPVLWSAEHQYIKVKEYIKRFNSYKKFDKSVITIWPEAILEFPFLLYEFADYHWVCLRREPWETILSFYISSKNNNFDGRYVSQPITIKEEAFKKMYWDYHKTVELQDWLVKNCNATPVDFNQLIAGNSSVFGVTYPVNSKDEHAKLEPLIENLNQVKQWYNTLELKRQTLPIWR